MPACGACRKIRRNGGMFNGRVRPSAGKGRARRASAGALAGRCGCGLAAQSRNGASAGRQALPPAPPVRAFQVPGGWMRARHAGGDRQSAGRTRRPGRAARPEGPGAARPDSLDFVPADQPERRRHFSQAAGVPGDKGVRSHGYSLRAARPGPARCAGNWRARRTAPEAGRRDPGRDVREQGPAARRLPRAVQARSAGGLSGLCPGACPALRGPGRKPCRLRGLPCRGRFVPAALAKRRRLRTRSGTCRHALDCFPAGGGRASLSQASSPVLPKEGQEDCRFSETVSETVAAPDGWNAVLQAPHPSAAAEKAGENVCQTGPASSPRRAGNAPLRLPPVLGTVLASIKTGRPLRLPA